MRPRAISEIWLKQDWVRSEQLSKIGEWAGQKAQAGKLEFKEVGEKKLADLGRGHQGVAFFVSEEPQLNWSIFEQEKPQQVVILDGIEDPQNLGAMLRTTWLMGSQALFTTEDRAVGLTPTVCKVACGGAEHVAISTQNNFTPVLKKLKKHGFWVYGLAESGEKGLYELKLPEKVAWVVGAEGKGVRKAVLKECDEVVSIPQIEGGSSYNASVSLALALGEGYRQNIG